MIRNHAMVVDNPALPVTESETSQIKVKPKPNWPVRELKRRGVFGAIHNTPQNKRVDRMQRSLNRLETRFTSLNRKTIQLESSVRSLNNKKRSSDNRFRRLESRLQTLQNQLNDVRRQKLRRPSGKHLPVPDDHLVDSVVAALIEV